MGNDITDDKKKQILYGGYGGEEAIVDSNIVNIKADTYESLYVENVVAGGVEESGRACGNVVNIIGPKSLNSSNVDEPIVGRVVGADAWGNNAEISCNSVNISGNAIIAENVYGGGVASKPFTNVKVNGNKVNIGEKDSQDKVMVKGNIYGGYTLLGIENTFDNNHVVLNNVEVKQSVSGVYTGKVNTATGNTVTINSGTVIHDNVVGAAVEFSLDSEQVNGKTGKTQHVPENINDVNEWANGHYVSGNKVIMTGGKVGGVNPGKSETPGQVIGGYSRYGKVSGNSVEISGGTIGSTKQENNVYGGYGEIVIGNSVTVTGSSELYAHVHGGQGISTIIKDDEQGYRVERDFETKAEENAVTINLQNDGRLEGEIFGGSGMKTTGNTVTIQNGTISGSVHGGSADFTNHKEDEHKPSFTAEQNVVKVFGGTVSGDVKGGYGYTSKENKVVIFGGHLEGDITGGYGHIATENEITISSGELGKNLLGEDKQVVITGGTGFEACGNKTFITGGRITGEIYGAAAEKENDNLVSLSGGTIIGDVYASRGSSGVTGNNTIVLSQKANVENASLWGYQQKDRNNVFNTLEINADWTADDDVVGGSVIDVQGFKTVKFNNVKWVTGGKVLTITGGTQQSLANTEINISSKFFPDHT